MITECRESIRRDVTNDTAAALLTDDAAACAISDPSSMPRPLCATLSHFVKRYSEGRAGLRHRLPCT